MAKLRLDFDALQVESFDTSPGPRGRAGTVHANAEAAGAAGAGDYANTTPFIHTQIFDICQSYYDGTCDQDTCKESCKTCFGQDTCPGGNSGMSICFGTCPSWDKVCCV